MQKWTKAVSKEFLTRIRIDEQQVSLISIEDIAIEFGAATSEFEHFDIMRSYWTNELGERMDLIRGVTLLVLWNLE